MRNFFNFRMMVFFLVGAALILCGAFFSSAEEEKIDERTLKIDQLLMEEYEKFLEQEDPADIPPVVAEPPREKTPSLQAQKRAERRQLEEERRKQREQLRQAKAQALVEKKEKQDAQKRQRRLERVQRLDAYSQVKQRYEEALTAYKASIYDFAKDKTSELKDLLESPHLSGDYRQKMLKKCAALDERIHVKKQKAAAREARKRQRLEGLPVEVKAKEKPASEENPVVLKKPQDLKLLKQEQKEQQKEQAYQKKQEEILARKQDSLLKRRQKLKEREDARELERLAKKRRQRARDEQARIATEQKKADAGLRQMDYEIKVRRKQGAKELAKAEQEFVDEIDQMYKQAVELYEKGSYELSKKIFEDLDEVQPNYRLTKNYLSLLTRAFSEERGSPALSHSANEGTQRTRTDIVDEALDAFTWSE